MQKRGIFFIVLLSLILGAAQRGFAATSPGEVIFDDGAFALVSPDKNFEMKIGGRFQVRYWYAESDKDYPYIAAKDTSTFELFQARLQFWGRVFGPMWRYFLQLDFAADPIMKDGYIEFMPKDYFDLRMGYFRPPYTRQKITSGAALLFPKRAIATDALCWQRDTGVMIAGDVFEKKFTYQVGIFNGENEKTRTNNGKYMLYAARLVAQPFGDVGMFEARDKAAKKFGLAVGGSFIYNNPWIGDLDENGIEDRAVDARWGAETVMIWDRLYLQGELFGKQYHPLLTGYDRVDSLGWYAQGGVLVIPQRIQVGLRYSWFDPDTDDEEEDATDTDVAQEYTVGVNWFIHSYRLMLQSSYSYFTKDYPDYEDATPDDPYDAKSNEEHRFMLQIQMII